MTEFPTVRVAAVQATPIILDSGACIEKAVRLLEEAAGRGVQLAVLPETMGSAEFARARAGGRSMATDDAVAFALGAAAAG